MLIKYLNIPDTSGDVFSVLIVADVTLHRQMLVAMVTAVFNLSLSRYEHICIAVFVFIVHDILNCKLKTTYWIYLIFSMC